MRTRLLVLLAVALPAALPAGAQASSLIHSPADGLTVKDGDLISFDWAWGDGDLWSRLAFATSPQAPASQWSLSADTYYSSSASLPALGPGLRYWRLCTYRLGGEDDKCYLESEVRSFRVLPNPCANNRDDDGDLWIDQGDPGCRASKGATEVAACQDHQDNDGDGLTDRKDPGCLGDQSRASEKDPPVSASFVRILPSMGAGSCWLFLGLAAYPSLDPGWLFPWGKLALQVKGPRLALSRRLSINRAGHTDMVEVRLPARGRYRISARYLGDRFRLRSVWQREWVRCSRR